MMSLLRVPRFPPARASSVPRTAPLQLCQHSLERTKESDILARHKSSLSPYWFPVASFRSVLQPWLSRSASLSGWCTHLLTLTLLSSCHQKQLQQILCPQGLWQQQHLCQELLRVIRHAGRPMAIGAPGPGDGDGMPRQITREIACCTSVPELEAVLGSYGGGFDCINAAAALTKYAKLPGSSMSSTLFNKLADAWLNKLPASGSNGPANVLWACGNLGSAEHPVWSRTWQAFLKIITKDLLGGQPPNVRPQELLNVLYACAKLRQQPRPEELLLLAGSFVHPAVRERER